jgi:hypothetical protein
MSGVESVRDLVELIRSNPGECNYTGGLSEEDIARAEAEVGVAFPPSYRMFLRVLGSCEAGGAELLGGYRTAALGDRLLGTVSGTIETREDDRFPPELLVIEYDGMGGIVSLDTSQRNADGEYPVVVWDPDRVKRLADDFGSYALERCRRGLR